MGVGRVPNDQVGQTFERLLGLPVAVVVAVLWLVGAVLIATSVLVVYLVGSLLNRGVHIERVSSSHSIKQRSQLRWRGRV